MANIELSDIVISFCSTKLFYVFWSLFISIKTIIMIDMKREQRNIISGKYVEYQLTVSISINIIIKKKY
jgi:hypothetical protein